MRPRLLPCLVLFLLTVSSLFAQTQRQLTDARLREAIEGYWIGKLAGNYIGLPFENLYKDAPLPMSSIVTTPSRMQNRSAC